MIENCNLIMILENMCGEIFLKKKISDVAGVKRRNLRKSQIFVISKIKN